MKPTHTNISLRMTVEQADFIRRWAHEARRTVTDMGGELLLMWAASDLGEPAPKAQKQSRPPSPIAQAAATRNMTRDQFRQWAAELVAEATLRDSQMPPAAQPTHSTMIPRPISGERPAFRRHG
jgi:uncharacterized protein (DUF1778 family)